VTSQGLALRNFMTSSQKNYPTRAPSAGKNAHANAQKKITTHFC